MINTITKSISRAIKKEFGDQYKIYSDEVQQGLREPCFFVLCINPTNRLYLGRRYLRTNQFCIQYLPESRKKREECNEVAERLYICLELIEMEGDLIRGTKMQHEIVDSVLNFFVNYDMFLLKGEEKEEMKTMEIKTTAKGG